MRAGILTSLRPFFVEGDTMSTTILHLLKRMLQRADVVDLANVLLSAQSFIDEMELQLNEYRELRDQFAAALTAETNDENPDDDIFPDGTTTDVRGYDPGSGGTDDGTGNPGGENPVREVDIATVSDSDLLQTLQQDGESPGDRHETPLAGGESSNGSIPEAAVS